LANTGTEKHSTERAEIRARVRMADPLAVGGDAGGDHDHGEGEDDVAEVHGWSV
jgi:hypothetical protein